MTKPYIIGITGGSGSGKTTIINKIKEQFGPEQVCIISQDDYYLDRELQVTDPEGYQNFDLPKSIDKKSFYRDLEKLSQGESFEKLEYVFNNKDASQKLLTFHPAPIIVVEGLFVFHYKKIKRLLNLKIYVHAKENLKVIRRIKRDRIERGYPLDDVLYRYEHHVLPSFEKYVLPYMEDADLVLNNHNSFENGLEVLIGFIQSKVS
ncbi:MAG: uridine kinase family protein [Saprospiraceae bacterium]